MPTSVIPQNFSEWKHCITVECGIPLTGEFVAARLVSMQDRSNEHTRQFLKCFGEAHYNNVLAWFEQAKNSGV